MKKKKAENMEVKLVEVPQWQGISKAAKALGVTRTQLNRHLNSEPGEEGYSMKLAMRIEELGIEVKK